MRASGFDYRTGTDRISQVRTAVLAAPARTSLGQLPRELWDALRDAMAHLVSLGRRPRASRQG
jgi:hypothetical protein